MKELEASGAEEAFDGAAIRNRYVSLPEPRFFDQATAAAYLGLSERYFETQWRLFKLPYPRRMGRRRVWDRKVLDRWADITSGLTVAEAVPSSKPSPVSPGRASKGVRKPKKPIVS